MSKVLTHRTSGAMHLLAEQFAIRSRKVDELEDAKM